MSGTGAQLAGTDDLVVHASCVAINGRGLLIQGASGSGKSSLSLELMAFGAMLVSDDRVQLTREKGLIARAPATISGLIEARGVGLLNADPYGPVEVAAVVALDLIESERLPPIRYTRLLGQTLPLLYRADTPSFAAMVMQYMKAGRQEE